MTPASREAMEKHIERYKSDFHDGRRQSVENAWKAAAEFYEQGWLKSMRKHYEKMMDELKSPPAQESPEVRELVEALEFYANDVFREADDYDEEYMSMEDIPETQFLYGRTARKALAAYYAKKGKL